MGFLCYDSCDKHYEIDAIKTVYGWPVSMQPRFTQTTKRQKQFHKKALAMAAGDIEGFGSCLSIAAIFPNSGRSDILCILKEPMSSLNPYL